jgi:hypothetical protein
MSGTYQSSRASRLYPNRYQYNTSDEAVQSHLYKLMQFLDERQDEIANELIAFAEFSRTRRRLIIERRRGNDK